MNIIEISKLQVGDSIFYCSEPFKVLWKCPQYPPTIIRDDNGKLVEVPDESVGIAFEHKITDKRFHLTSNVKSKSAIDGKLYPLELPNYGTKI